MNRSIDASSGDGGGRTAARGRRWRAGDTDRVIEGEGEAEVDKRETEARTEAIKERDRRERCA